MGRDSQGQSPGLRRVRELAEKHGVSAAIAYSVSLASRLILPPTGFGVSDAEVKVAVQTPVEGLRDEGMRVEGMLPVAQPGGWRRRFGLGACWAGRQEMVRLDAF